SPSEKLAASLEVLKALQENGEIAIKSSSFTRTHKERLVKHGFIKEVYVGWFIISSPEQVAGESTAWYSSYWTFCAQYLTFKYKDQWHLSAEQSLKLHAGNWVVPKQLIIKSPKANNFKTDLPFDTSLFHMKSTLPNKAEMVVIDGLRVLSLSSALVKVSLNGYAQNDVDIRTALSLIKTSSEILEILLSGGQSIIAGRLAGAFRNIKRDRIADDIIKTMQKVGYEVRESDPFKNNLEISFTSRDISPYANRLKIMWLEFRNYIIEKFPTAPSLPTNIEKYISDVKEMYVTDAYHSLSIEKYKVTPELIEKVRSGSWNAKGNEEDRKQRDAMAAKGYWDAFQIVEKSIRKVLVGENAGKVLDADHGDWYTALFGTSVVSGILKPSDLAGYRNHQVYITNSKHVPLNKEAVRDAMPVLMELLEQESEASVRAVLGHFIFVFIHPYMDGNGRMGRFVMNLMLASGGYPWTVIPVQQREVYMKSLEEASVHLNIKPFVEFISHLVSESIQGKPVAKI
ncbi:MAG: Fic family protein, partial [Bacteroidetes bacterium]|nr:Fic family protein [Bacteroidota bacterium]